MEDDNYQYTEEDVEIALRFLRIHCPRYATPENAVRVLIFCKEKATNIKNLSSEAVENYLLDKEDN